MSLRRGFKAKANRISLDLRRALGLTPEAPIKLDEVVHHLKVAHKIDVIIVGLSCFQSGYPSAVRQLSIIDPSAFSATTLPSGSNRYVIVHNDSHDKGRQQTNIAHEIAHLLLKHPFTLPIDTNGCRNFDRDIEDEAALYIVKSGMVADDARRTYGVSEPVLRMRVNASGARIRAARVSRYN